MLPLPAGAIPIYLNKLCFDEKHVLACKASTEPGGTTRYILSSGKRLVCPDDPIHLYKSFLFRHMGWES